MCTYVIWIMVWNYLRTVKYQLKLSLPKATAMWVNRVWQCLKNYSRENKHCHKWTMSGYLGLKFTRDDFLSQCNCWRSLSSKMCFRQPMEAVSSACHMACVQGQRLLVRSRWSQVNQTQLEGHLGLCSRRENAAAVFCFQRVCSSKVALWLPGFSFFPPSLH